MQNDLLHRLLVSAPLASLALFGLMAVTSGIAAQFATAPEPDEPGSAVLALLVVCAVNATLLVWTILRSAARGARLAGLVFALYFGIAAFMTQNETWYFNRALAVPAGIVWGYLAASLVTAGLFAAGVARFFRHDAPDAPVRTGMTRDGRIWKIALLACGVYPLLYFAFGYFVLWQNEAARLLYQGSTELLPAGGHLAGILRDDPWLYPWQCLRGLFWVGLGVLVMRDSTAGRVETAVLVGLLFALLMNMQHLIPNPYMPPEVRYWHFVETSSSNFLWGLAVVSLLRARTP